MHPLQLTGRAWGHQFVNWNSAQAHGAIATTDKGEVSPNVCQGCNCENSRNNVKFKTQVACDSTIGWGQAEPAQTQGLSLRPVMRST